MRPRAGWRRRTGCPSVAVLAPKRTWNQYAITLCRMKPPAKASSANRPESRATMPRERWSPRKSPGAAVDAARRHLDRGGQAREEQREERRPRPRSPRSSSRYADEVRHPPLLREVREPARRERPAGGGDRAGQVVPREHARAIAVGDQLRQRGLLDREKRPHLVAARTDDADDGRGHEQLRPLREQERDAPHHHERRAHDQHVAAAPPVGVRRDPQRDAGVPQEREREQEPDGGPAHADATPGRARTRSTGSRRRTAAATAS